MPAPLEVIRRFSVSPGETSGLGRLERILRRAVAAGSPLSVSLDRIEELQRLDVRLRGAPDAAALVVKRLLAAGAGISKDLTEVPLEARRPGEFPELQPLLSIQGRPASKARSRNPDVVVAIVDSGLHVDHREVSPHLWTNGPPGMRYGARCMDGTVDGDVNDDDGHGTNLAGTILAVAGATGRIKLMAVKFFDAVTRPKASNAARGIDFAVANGATIILLSWDLGLESEELRRSIRTALSAGKLVVFAAGNGGSNNDELKSVPSLYASEGRSRAITVMAVTRYGEKAWFSNYGDKRVDIGAPGVAILTTAPYLSRNAASAEGQRRRLHRYSGTSAAAAHVAGAAALIMAHHPHLSAEVVKRSLTGPQPKTPRPPADPRRLRCVSGEVLDVRAALTRAAEVAAAAARN